MVPVEDTAYCWRRYPHDFTPWGKVEEKRNEMLTIQKNNGGHGERLEDLVKSFHAH